ncbi:hypothetical protein SDC9_194013 [bioreactor metagenome]|uniref:Uncharacterized protein n=1 Tax=bioreactor metagenome TaxID=1076179 RepID=A0A645I541_9ZZZZ
MDADISAQHFDGTPVDRILKTADHPIVKDHHHNTHSQGGDHDHRAAPVAPDVTPGKFQV